MSPKRIPGGVVHEMPADLKKALASDPQALTAWEDIIPLARNEWICWVESAKKAETRSRRIEWGCSSLKDGKRRPCCWPGCVGPDAPTANSRMVKLDIAIADWSRPTSGLGVFRQSGRSNVHRTFPVQDNEPTPLTACFRTSTMG
jgi:hypothetical protein